MADTTTTTTTPPAAPATPAVPDLVGAYISGDMTALRGAVHDRTVAQVQGYVNNAEVIQGKVDPK